MKKIMLIMSLIASLGFTVPLEADLPLIDPRPTLVVQVCTEGPHSGNIVFKAQNDKRRFIVRSVHCWKI